MMVMLENKETHKVSDFVGVRSITLMDNGLLRLVTPEYSVFADLELFVFQIVEEDDIA